MTTTMRALLGITTAILATGAACRWSQRDALDSRGGEEPRDPFSYLCQRYDRDQNGVVTADEYTRGDSTFVRLDANGDGRLTAQDFGKRGRRVRALSADSARRLRAQHLVAWYLQNDGDPARFDVTEAVATLDSLDTDGDGEVGRSEFEARAHEQATKGRVPDGAWWGLIELETTDPWERLIEGIDRNRDGFLNHRELRGFFASTRLHSWDFVADATQHRRAKPGLRAPDFTLPNTNGRGSTTLSTFAGKRPVALIFGSYT